MHIKIADSVTLSDKEFYFPLLVTAGDDKKKNPVIAFGFFVFVSKTLFQKKKSTRERKDLSSPV